jgi:hypothetical protein
MDEAFRSRIHVSLYYPSLEWAQTQAIWNHHLTKLVASDRIRVDKNSILAYAKTIFRNQRYGEHQMAWNGRQIRNAFQTAVALAEFEHLSDNPDGPLNSTSKPVLKPDQFKTVSKVSTEFDDYLMRVLGKTNARHVAIKELRDDLTGSQGYPVQVPASEYGYNRRPSNSTYQRSSINNMTNYTAPSQAVPRSYGQQGPGRTNPGMMSYPTTDVMGARQPQVSHPIQNFQMHHDNANIPANAHTYPVSLQGHYSHSAQGQMISQDGSYGDKASGSPTAQPAVHTNAPGQPPYRGGPQGGYQEGYQSGYQGAGGHMASAGPAFRVEQRSELNKTLMTRRLVLMIVMNSAHVLF